MIIEGLWEDLFLASLIIGTIKLYTEALLRDELPFTLLSTLLRAASHLPFTLISACLA